MANDRDRGNSSPPNIQPQQESPVQMESAGEEMPMKRYINPIPLCVPQERDHQEQEEGKELLEAQTQVLLRILERLEQMQKQEDT